MDREMSDMVGCTPPAQPPEMTTEVGSMHPTGLHSCFF